MAHAHTLTVLPAWVASTLLCTCWCDCSALPISAHNEVQIRLMCSLMRWLLKISSNWFSPSTTEPLTNNKMEYNKYMCPGIYTKSFPIAISRMHKHPLCISSDQGEGTFPFMGTRTASPRGRYGERPQRDSVWRYIWKNTTCWPATAHDVTTGVPQYKCRREDTSSAFSSSLTGLFEACRVNLVRVQFSNSTMASTSKAFRKCVDPCPRYLTPDDTHDCCVFCLGMEHARDVLEGAVCVRCERLSMRKLSSRLSLFSRKEGQPSASRDSRPTVAEARRRMKSWGSQLVVADKLERDRPLFARRPRTRVSCWIVMMRSFWHH